MSYNFLKHAQLNINNLKMFVLFFYTKFSDKEFMSFQTGKKKIYTKFRVYKMCKIMMYTSKTLKCKKL